MQTTERSNRQLLALYLGDRTQTWALDALCERTGPTLAIAKSCWLCLIGECLPELREQLARCEGRSGLPERFICIPGRIAAFHDLSYRAAPTAEELADKQQATNEALGKLDGKHLGIVKRKLGRVVDSAVMSFAEVLMDADPAPDEDCCPHCGCDCMAGAFEHVEHVGVIIGANGHA